MIISPEDATLAAFKRPARRAGGIASMAAAAFMIRDGDMLGTDITILEESAVIGGSPDGSGSPEEGYVLRGGRMIESKYLCTFAPPRLSGRIRPPLLFQAFAALHDLGPQPALSTA